MTSEVNVDCIGCCMMTSSVFKLVPYTPPFKYAIISATGYDLKGKLRLDLQHQESASTIMQNRERIMLSQVTK